MLITMNKKDKMIYWISTGLVTLVGVSAINYFINPIAIEGFATFGFPSYFRIELGVAKIIAAIVIITPKIPSRIKEWAYVGFGITFISAIITHATVEGYVKAIPPMVCFLMLGVSYFYFHKLQSK